MGSRVRGWAGRVEGYCGGPGAMMGRVVVTEGQWIFGVKNSKAAPTPLHKLPLHCKQLPRTCTPP